MNDEGGHFAAYGEGLALSHTDEFLRQLTASLRSQLGVDGAWVGEVVGDYSDRVRVLSGSASQNVSGLGEYELCGAPCATVVEQSTPVVIPHEAAQRFPMDRYFVDNEIASYCAVPLLGAAGAPLGLLGVCSQETLREPQQIVDSLSAIAPRTAHEIEEARTKEALDYFSQLLLVKRSPDELFGDLANRLARAFRSSLAAITEWREEDRSTTQVLAYVEAGRVADTMFGTRLELAGVPCGLIAQEGQIVIEDNLQQQFPGFPGWSSLRPIGYAGAMVYGTDGEALGHVAIASDKRIPRKTLETPLWSVFATQIAVCIEKMKTDRKRRLLDNIYSVNQRVRDRGTAASVLGHDIGNLLTAITMSAELCDANLEPDSEARRHIRSVQAASAEASKLAAKLLRGTAHRRDSRTRTDVADFISMLDQALTAVGGDRVRVRVQSVAPGLEVYVDQDEFAQVLLNLVGNAVDACSDEGGEVAISVSTDLAVDEDSVRAGHYDPLAKYVFVTVSDNGCGIPPERLAAILGSAQSSKPGGHGIGLLAVRDIATRHDAAISIVSRVNQGTIVTVCWPADDDGAPLRQEHLGEQEHTTVLIVDDEPMIRSTLKSVVEQAGLEPLLADGGRSAIEAARKGIPIDVAIIDVSMPGMDGWTLLTELRKINPALPIVMMSGYFPMKDRRAVVNESVCYLHKPFKVASVYESLESAVGITVAK